MVDMSPTPYGYELAVKMAETANTTTKPRINFGKRSQISDGFALSARLSMWLVQM